MEPWNITYSVPGIEDEVFEGGYEELMQHMEMRLNVAGVRYQIERYTDQVIAYKHDWDPENESPDDILANAVP
jgi:hypothetical protein